MAKQMSYTDPNTGATFPASVWLPIGVYIDASGPSVKIDFLGYRDLATAAGVVGAALGVPGAVKKGPVGAVSYTLSQAEFAQFAMGPPAHQTMLDCISQSCYDIADASTQNRKPDPNDPEATVGFFHGAADVSLSG